MYYMALSNIQLEDIAKQLKLPIVGVYSKDELPTRRSVGSYYINMANDKDVDGKPLDGTHWVFARIFNKKEAIYFDSFGVDMPAEVRTFLKPFEPIPFNNREIQDIQSEHCGLFCVSCDYFFQYDTDKKATIQDNYGKYLNGWSENTKSNDTVLKQYFNK